jgi:hypothetical protein
MPCQTHRRRTRRQDNGLRSTMLRALCHIIQRRLRYQITYKNVRLPSISFDVLDANFAQIFLRELAISLFIRHLQDVCSTRKAGTVLLLNSSQIKLPNDVGVTPCWMRSAEWAVTQLHLHKLVNVVRFCCPFYQLSSCLHTLDNSPSDRTGHIPCATRLGQT